MTNAELNRKVKKTYKTFVELRSINQVEDWTEYSKREAALKSEIRNCFRADDTAEALTFKSFKMMFKMNWNLCDLCALEPFTLFIIFYRKLFIATLSACRFAVKMRQLIRFPACFAMPPACIGIR